jgi:putative RNA 2'-phosphotransferase
MAIDYIRLSKTMSHALRHEPWVYELELDEQGAVAIDELLASLREERREWCALTADDVANMMARSDKQRFELLDGRIRAFYGHSIPGKLMRTPAAPPEILFHGTSPGIVPKIATTGLRPMRRQYVHLSADRETATAVGRRKASAPVILEVLAQKASQAGERFYIGNEMVWLADGVSPQFIVAPREP